MVGIYPHDARVLRELQATEGNTGNPAAPPKPPGNQKKTVTGCEKNVTLPGAGRTGHESASPSLNPYSFNSLSMLLRNQDAWRRTPAPEMIDFECFRSSAKAGTSAVWYMLLMIEDELDRSKSSKFHCIHPTASTVMQYLPLYKNTRFSDHLLARWVLDRGMDGPLRPFIPRYLRPVEEANVLPRSPSTKRSHSVDSSVNSTPQATPRRTGGAVEANTGSSSRKLRVIQDVMQHRNVISLTPRKVNL